MTKKDFLISILSIVGKERALAQAIKILLENNELNDAFMDGLMRMMNNFVEQTTDLKKKEAMKKGIDMIKKLQQKETQEKEVDQQDMKNLEELMNNVA